ncbi:unnamed protein product [Blepharisma stoltei]|uniref:Uncharacterized protein n=1 Tax=Blepharisma stoltei TaxID=1481888 RepID=A0AAU9JRC6_9CILI|nr:unnamed protein product [Blepharisma stoltei]
MNFSIFIFLSASAFSISSSSSFLISCVRSCANLYCSCLIAISLAFIKFNFFEHGLCIIFIFSSASFCFSSSSALCVFSSSINWSLHSCLYLSNSSSHKLLNSWNSSKWPNSTCSTSFFCFCRSSFSLNFCSWIFNFWICSTAFSASKKFPAATLCSL